LKQDVVILTPDRQIDRRILLQAESLEKAGWQVKIIAMPLDKQETEDSTIIRIGGHSKANNRENFIVDLYRYLRKNLPMNGRLMRAMKRFTWRYLVDQETFYFKLFYNTASKYSPAVFMACDLPMLPIANRLAKESGARLVYDSHELYSEQEFSKHEKKRWSEVESKYISHCDSVITVNPSIAIELQSRYAIKNVNVIYNAEKIVSDIPKLKIFHEIFNLSCEKKILILQGGISSGRNLEILIQAMLLIKNSSIVLVVLGDGLQTKNLKKLVKKYNLEKRVFFHKAVPQKDLLRFTASADAGVIPYQATCLNNFYCTPNKLFEFISVGLPIISTDLPELRKIIKEEKIGLVGDTSTAEEFAKLIDDFFSNENRFDDWKENIEIVRKKYCWEKEEKKLIRIFESFR
jgi:glycosyltransferase involved in cell wall biosynthesis